MRPATASSTRTIPDDHTSPQLRSQLDPSSNQAHIANHPTSTQLTCQLHPTSTRTQLRSSSRSTSSAQLRCQLRSHLRSSSDQISSQLPFPPSPPRTHVRVFFSGPTRVHRLVRPWTPPEPQNLVEYDRLSLPEPESSIHSSNPDPTSLEVI